MTSLCSHIQTVDCQIHRDYWNYEEPQENLTTVPSVINLGLDSSEPLSPSPVTPPASSENLLQPPPPLVQRKPKSRVEQLGGKSLLPPLAPQKIIERRRKRYDADVLTKWVVYAGIGYLATSLLPRIFGYMGLSVM